MNRMTIINRIARTPLVRAENLEKVLFITNYRVKLTNPKIIISKFNLFINMYKHSKYTVFLSNDGKYIYLIINIVSMERMGESILRSQKIFYINTQKNHCIIINMYV